MPLQLPVRATSIETIVPYLERRGIEDTLPEHIRPDLLAGDKTAFALAPTPYEDPFQNIAIFELTRTVIGKEVSRKFAEGQIFMIDRNFKGTHTDGLPMHRLRMVGSNERFCITSNIEDWRNNRRRLAAEAIFGYANAKLDAIDRSRHMLAGLSTEALLVQQN